MTKLKPEVLLWTDCNRTGVSFGYVLIASAVHCCNYSRHGVLGPADQICPD